VLLQLPRSFAEDRPILCIGAHCDDVEIGYGGTLVRLARDHARTKLVWAIFSNDRIRQSETRSATGALLARSPELIFFDFRQSFCPGCALTPLAESDGTTTLPKSGDSI
jgi:LmbE family N-acetylglucosaminyl deacetylase